MNLGRTPVWIAVALAMVVHLLAGIAGSGTQVCVCSSGITVERQGAGCCDLLSEAAEEAARNRDCTDCHVIPLPDASASDIGIPSSSLLSATLPEPTLLATITWPMSFAHRFARRQSHFSCHLPRFLRPMVLTC